jgi:predicted RNase H-like nuclease (RuvC/YqgF family)
VSESVRWRAAQLRLEAIRERSRELERLVYDKKDEVWELEDKLNTAQFELGELESERDSLEAEGERIAEYKLGLMEGRRSYLLNSLV